jgi:hypothetical protein
VEVSSPPEGLGPAGRALYEKIISELPPGMEYDPREMELLAQAAVCADTIAALDAVVARSNETGPSPRTAPSRSLSGWPLWESDSAAVSRREVEDTHRRRQ